MSACIVPGCRGTNGARDAGHDRHACEPCVRTLQRQLRELAEYHIVLTVMTAPLQGRGERRSPGFGSRPPTGLDRVVALDYRSRTGGDGEDDEEQPTRSILGTLHQLARWIREEQDVVLRGEPTVDGEIGYLLGAMEWCARQPWVDEIARDIRELHAQCRRLAGDQPPKPIGKCPTLVGTGECGTPLFMPTKGDSIVCHGCGREWCRPEWERLAALLNDTVGRKAG